MAPFRDEVLAINSHIGYFITPYFHYYGIVNSNDYKIVIGPSMQTRDNDQSLKELAFRCDVPPEETEEFLSGMKSIVPMPLSSILQILCTMNYVLNGEKLGLSDLQIYDSEQENLKNKLEKERATQEFDSDIAEIEKQQEVHNTLTLEQTIVSFVRKGDTLSLKKWIENAPAVRPGGTGIRSVASAQEHLYSHRDSRIARGNTRRHGCGRRPDLKRRLYTEMRTFQQSGGHY